MRVIFTEAAVNPDKHHQSNEAWSIMVITTTPDPNTIHFGCILHVFMYLYASEAVNEAIMRSIVVSRRYPGNWSSSQTDLAG